MRYIKLFAPLAVAIALLATSPSDAAAQGRSRGRAVPRGSVRGAPGPRAGGPSSRVGGPRVYYGARPFRYVPRVNFSFFYGSPGYFGSYVYGRPFWGYGPLPYGYLGYGYMDGFGPGYAPYGYGYGGYSGRPYGGVRLDLAQKDAEVYVDGYFVGTVDDFDGRLQQANLEAGPHHVEVRADGFEPIEFDVNVEPGRTITYRGDLRPLDR